MAEVRPFRALRYNPAVAGNAADLVAPPYDVVAGEARRELYARSPYNVARVDYGEDRPDIASGVDHYALAARELGEWLASGVLIKDEAPHLYVYDQEFRLGDETHRRRAVFGALRLEEWDKRIVLPHEVTGAGAKLDRQRLLEATATHLSPIMGLYEPTGMQGLLDDGIEAPVLDAVLPDARHTLSPLTAEAARAFADAISARQIYVADGHHRYETALTYRDQRRAEAGQWTGDEGYNFVLAGLVASDDPGFVVLPTHRLLKLPEREADLSSALDEHFEVTMLGDASPANVASLVAQMAARAASGPVFGAIGLQPDRLHLIAPRGLDGVLAMTPSDQSDAWRRLDVTILAYAALPGLGYDGAPEHIDYTEDAQHALQAVQDGDFDLALLVNPTTIADVIAVSNTGDRMARKSTFFYPKLATGVVMLPTD